MQERSVLTTAYGNTGTNPLGTTNDAVAVSADLARDKALVAKLQSALEQVGDAL